MATFGPCVLTPYVQEDPPDKKIIGVGFLKGVLLVEGAYLEPTIGQIWPR